MFNKVVGEGLASRVTESTVGYGYYGSRANRSFSGETKAAQVGGRIRDKSNYVTAGASNRSNGSNVNLADYLG